MLLKKYSIEPQSSLNVRKISATQIISRSVLNKSGDWNLLLRISNVTWKIAKVGKDKSAPKNISIGINEKPSAASLKPLRKQTITGKNIGAIMTVEIQSIKG